MSRSRILSVVAAVILLGAGVLIGVRVADDADGTAAAATGTSSATSVAPKAGDSRLFVIDGAHGWAAANGDGWTVILEQPKVLWFDDRPSRASGHLTATDLTRQWPTAFAGSDPNGALEAPDGPSGEEPVALVLHSPVYDAATDAISFAVRADEGMTTQDEAWLTAFTKAQASEFGAVTLFVDSSTYTSTNTITALFPDPIVLTADVQASTCATPMDANLAKQGRQVVDLADGDEYDGPTSVGPVSMEISNVGLCYFTISEGQWDVWSKGTKVGSFSLSSSMGTVDCGDFMPQDVVCGSNSTATGIVLRACPTYVRSSGYCSAE